MIGHTVPQEMCDTYWPCLRFQKTPVDRQDGDTNHIEASEILLQPFFSISVH